MSLAAPSSGRLKLSERIGYAAGDLGCSMYWIIFAQYLMFFYTDTIGLDAAAIATMLAVTRLWDTLVDPIMGLIADRTKSRHGRYRPWLLWAAGPLIGCSVLTFLVPKMTPGRELLYVYVTYTFLAMTYSMINLPYAALMGVMTPDPRERTTLASFRYYGSFGGNLVVQVSILSLVAWLGRGNDRAGYPLAIGCYGLLAAALFAWTFFATKERVIEAPGAAAASIRKDLGHLLRNRPWVALAIAIVLTLVWMSLRGAVTVYYFKYYIGNQALSSTFLGLGTVGSLVGILFTKPVIRLFGDKRRAFIGLSAWAALTSGALYGLAPTQLGLLYACQLAHTICWGQIMVLMFSMLADTADYGEWRFDRRTTGLIFAAGTGALKFGWTIGGALSGWLLKFYGYHANVTQTPEALLGLRSLMSWIPALGAAATVAVACFYPISAATEQSMGSDLEARKRGAVPAA